VQKKKKTAGGTGAVKEETRKSGENPCNEKTDTLVCLQMAQGVGALRETALGKNRKRAQMADRNGCVRADLEHRTDAPERWKEGISERRVTWKKSTLYWRSQPKNLPMAAKEEGAPDALGERREKEPLKVTRHLRDGTSGG